MKKLWQFKIDFIRKNPILSSYISFMKGVLITLIVCCLLSSCVSYKQYSKEPDIVSVLAVTSKGDTIQLSTDYLRKEFESNSGNYSNWRFNWQNNWYYGYGWYNYYDPYWIYRIPYQNRIVIPKQPQQRYIPRHFDNRPNPPIRREGIVVQPNRGRSNVQPPMRQPQQPKVQQPPMRQPQRNIPNRDLGGIRRPVQN